MSALWDSKGAGMISINILNESLQKNRYDIWKKVEPKLTPEEVGALLNSPDIPLYEIGVQILRLPDTPAEFAIEALSKGGLSVEESLQSKMEGMKFSAKTVSFLRIVTKKNLGDDPQPWIEWLRSIRN
jgi:hypothetical protein